MEIYIYIHMCFLFYLYQLVYGAETVLCVRFASGARRICMLAEFSINDCKVRVPVRVMKHDRSATLPVFGVCALCGGTLAFNENGCGFTCF